MYNIYICIPVFNRINYTISCLKSIENQTYKKYKVIIYDDLSTDGTPEILEANFPYVKLLKGTGNLWWTGGINECIKEVLRTAKKNDYVFTLNNDTELLPDTLQKLIKFSLENPNTITGAVNILYTNPLTIEPSAFSFSSKRIFLKKLHFKVNQFGESIINKNGVLKVNTLSGKGVLYPVEIFNNIGLFNFEKLPHYHADTEFVLRAGNNGYKVFLNYDAKVLSHHELTGSGTNLTKQNFINFIRSFFTLKSVNHIPSLYNFTKLVYKKSFLFYFCAYVLMSIGGYIKRKF